MKNLLKFITCGSVDDGKSTLIGHMLYDAKLLFADHVQTLELNSSLSGKDGEMDYSLLLDGLMAEREQGITIDVAYRYFSTKNRSFIVADCPGHEQYTRNMAVGASFADLAVILVDVSRGVSVQTKRHLRICALMGIRHVVLAVNKMDTLQYDQKVFTSVMGDFVNYASEFNLSSIKVIPLSAKKGDNIVNASENTDWYKGPTLLQYLEEVDIASNKNNQHFVMPVQRVTRITNFRGFQGQIETGNIEIGDKILSLPSKEKALVQNIYVAGDECDSAVTGQAVTITLDREVDVSRGCVLTTNADIEVSNMFNATVLWMGEEPLVAGRNYLMKCNAKLLPATVLTIKDKVEIESGKLLATKNLYKNEIAHCDISVSEKIPISPFKDYPALGSFILIDRLTNATSACGVIEHTLRRADNVVWQNIDISRDIRSNLKGQSPATLWFTGLSGSGKSTLANALEKRLVSVGRHTMLLDGDNIRHGLNKDLGFTERDRVENIRRISEVARLLNDAGLIVLVSFIAPYEQDRNEAKLIIGEGYKEIYVSTPLEVCEQRDVKGLYKKARAGEIPEFTGISSPYEVPSAPDFSIDTSQYEVDVAIDHIFSTFFFE